MKNRKFHKMNEQPLVSVGIPLYNHAQYVEQCLESVVNQTYSNIQLIIIDDGSSDNSYEVAKSYLENKQTRFTNYIFKTRTNRGLCKTLNEILSLAKGDYFTLCASDDYWVVEKTQEQVNFLEQNPRYTLVHSNSIEVDNNSQKISEISYSQKINQGKLFEAIIFGKGGINTVSAMYNINIHSTIGFYDETLKIEDLDFWLRLTKEFEIGFIDKFHTYYRRHDKNLSHESTKLSFLNLEIAKIYKKNIADPGLLNAALSRIYRKSYLAALRKGRFIYFYRYILLYLKLKHVKK